MKQLFLIDFENVGEQGLSGIRQLKNNDELVIFHSGNISPIIKELLTAYEEKGIKISYPIRTTSEKNAVDFMIATHLGFVCGRKSKMSVHIVSKDKGFQSAIAHAMLLDKQISVNMHINIAEEKAEIKDMRKEKYLQLLSDSDVPKKYHDQLISVFTSGASQEETETKIKKILGKKNAGYADAAMQCYHVD